MEKYPPPQILIFISEFFRCISDFLWFLPNFPMVTLPPPFYLKIPDCLAVFVHIYNGIFFGVFPSFSKDSIFVSYELDEQMQGFSTVWFPFVYIHFVGIRGFQQLLFPFWDIFRNFLPLFQGYKICNEFDTKTHRFWKVVTPTLVDFSAFCIAADMLN